MIKTPLQRIRRGILLLAAVFLVAVCGYRVLDARSWLDAVYMFVVTVSTVGYGERSTLNPSMQALSIAVITIGISAAAYTVGGLIQLMF